MHYTKKIARSVAAAGLAIVLTVGTAFASVGTATVTADALRLRSEANTGSRTLALVYKGATVELLSEEENGWYKVSYQGKEGYMSAQWLDAVITVTGSAGTAVEETPAEEQTSAEETPAQEPSVEDTPAEEAPAETGGVSATSSDSMVGVSVVVTADSLNVRSGPGTEYGRIGSLKKGTELTILEDHGDWYKVTTGKMSGYVSASFVSTEAVTQQAIVLAGPLNVRSGPGTGYSRVGTLKLGATVEVLGSSNGWYQISTGSLTGYVSGQYVSILEELTSSPVGAAAAALAASLVGCRYVYGAEGPTTFDCSGLSYYIFGQLGYKLSRGASGQYTNNGKFVSRADLEPGDLVFFFDPKYDYSGGTLPTTHMGIYVGNGQFIHAATTSRKVEYENLEGSYLSNYIVGYKRIG